MDIVQIAFVIIFFALIVDITVRIIEFIVCVVIPKIRSLNEKGFLTESCDTKEQENAIASEV